MPLQPSVTQRLFFSCTLAQFVTAMGTTLPAAGFTVIQAPQKFQGELVPTSGGAVGLTDCDFTYDGNRWLQFFSLASSPNSSAYYNNTLPGIIAYLTTTLAGTLGAPVPGPIAHNASYAGDV